MVESLGSSVLFMIIPLLHIQLNVSKVEALLITIKALGVEYLVQWLTIWYCTAVLRNNNPFWYTMFSSLFGFLTMFCYALEPSIARILLYFVFRRCFITFHIHGINLCKCEEQMGTPYRKMQYTSHWVTQFLVMAFLPWLIRVLCREQGLAADKLPLIQIIVPAFWALTVGTSLGVPASAYLCYSYYQDREMVYKTREKNRFPVYIKTAHWKWY